MLYLGRVPLKIIQSTDFYIFRLYIVFENPTYTLFVCLFYLLILLLSDLIIVVSDKCRQL